MMEIKATIVFSSDGRVEFRGNDPVVQAQAVRAYHLKIADAQAEGKREFMANIIKFLEKASQ